MSSWTAQQNCLSLGALMTSWCVHPLLEHTGGTVVMKKEVLQYFCRIARRSSPLLTTSLLLFVAVKPNASWSQTNLVAHPRTHFLLCDFAAIISAEYVPGAVLGGSDRHVSLRSCDHDGRACSPPLFGDGGVSTNLVPYPHILFSGPLGRSSRLRRLVCQRQLLVGEVTMSVFEPGYMVVECDLRHGSASVAATEFQAHLVCFLRIHFLLCDLAPFIPATKA